MAKVAKKKIGRLKIKKKIRGLNGMWLSREIPAAA
jgi:hypothetical protein